MENILHAYIGTRYFVSSHLNYSMANILHAYIGTRYFVSSRLNY